MVVPEFTLEFQFLLSFPVSCALCSVGSKSYAQMAASVGFQNGLPGPFQNCFIFCSPVPHFSWKWFFLLFLGVSEVEGAPKALFVLREVWHSSDLTCETCLIWFHLLSPTHPPKFDILAKLDFLPVARSTSLLGFLCVHFLLPFTSPPTQTGLCLLIISNHNNYHVMSTLYLLSRTADFFKYII